MYDWEPFLCMEISRPVCELIPCWPLASMLASWRQQRTRREPSRPSEAVAPSTACLLALLSSSTWCSSPAARAIADGLSPVSADASSVPNVASVCPAQRPHASDDHTLAADSINESQASLVMAF